MRYIILGGLIASVIAGCATGARSPKLAKYENAEFEPWMSAQAVTAVTLKRRGGVTAGDALAVCVAENISNKSVTLQDAAGSFVGAYSGRYYHAGTTRDAGGGDVLSYVSQDGRSVIANGTTEYQATALVRRAVRFKLSVKVGDNGRSFRFSELEHAQLSTGYAANDGFHKIGQWEGANPDLALASLEDAANKINHCLDM